MKLMMFGLWLNKPSKSIIFTYACQTEENLKGWYVVHTVSPHGRLPLPNDEDYNLNPETHGEEFYQQEEGL
jgi:hypothetical protein